MSKKFNEKVVIVVGGGNGIGRAVSLRLAEEGSKVVIVNRSKENGEKTLQLVKEAGGEGIFIQGNASVAEDVQNYIAKTIEVYGKIDGLYNNVGITGDRVPLDNHSEDSFDHIMNVNVKSVFLSMKYAIPHMIKNGGGSIVNTASIAGVTGYPTFSPYAASKHAIIGLTKSAVGEYSKHNIRLNVICPGATHTETVVRDLGSHIPPEDLQHVINAMASKIPVGRLGKPDEIANVGCFLLSDEASFVNGAVYVADGGMTTF